MRGTARHNNDYARSTFWSVRGLHGSLLRGCQGANLEIRKSSYTPVSGRPKFQRTFGYLNPDRPRDELMRVWTEEERLEAVKAYLVTGSYEKAGVATGIPAATLAYWKNSCPDWWAEALKRA